MIFLHLLLLHTSGFHAAGRVVSQPPPSTPEWKGPSPTMTNTRDQNTLQKASGENLPFNLTLCWENASNGPLAGLKGVGKVFEPLWDHIEG